MPFFPIRTDHHSLIPTALWQGGGVQHHRAWWASYKFANNTWGTAIERSTQPLTPQITGEETDDNDDDDEKKKLYIHKIVAATQVLQLNTNSLLFLTSF
jgi:hypothetical protein